MRYSLQPSAQPLWLPLLPAGLPPSSARRRLASDPAAPGYAGTASAVRGSRGDAAASASAGRPLSSTGYDLWRLQVPHVTLGCGPLSQQSTAADADTSVGAGAASRSPRPPLTMGCVGSQAYLDWATAAVQHMGPPRRRASDSASSGAAVAPAASMRGRLASVPGGFGGSWFAPSSVAAANLEVCTSDTDDSGDDDDAVVRWPATGGLRDGDGPLTGCSGILTPSSRYIATPRSLLPTLVAAVNASCGGRCVLMPMAGLGLMCLVGHCGDAPSAQEAVDALRATGSRDAWRRALLAPPAGTPPGAVGPAGMPNLTFTVSIVPPGAPPDGPPLVVGAGAVSPPPQPPPGPPGPQWDLTLLPTDFTQLLSAEEVGERVDAAVAAPTPAGGGFGRPHFVPLDADGAAALRARLAADAAAGVSGYWRVLLQPLDAPDAPGPLAAASARNSGAPSLPTITSPSSFVSAWVLGTPFLQAFYSVYDADAMQVGLAPALPGRGPVPSRYNGGTGDDGWGHFWGSPAMWAAVSTVLASGLLAVGCFTLARQRRRARRAAAFEREYQEKLLLGLPVSEALPPPPGSGASAGGGSPMGGYDGAGGAGHVSGMLLDDSGAYYGGGDGDGDLGGSSVLDRSDYRDLDEYGHHRGAAAAGGSSSGGSDAHAGGSGGAYFFVDPGSGRHVGPPGPSPPAYARASTLGYGGGGGGSGYEAAGALSNTSALAGASTPGGSALVHAASVHASTSSPAVVRPTITPLAIAVPLTRPGSIGVAGSGSGTPGGGGGGSPHLGPAGSSGARLRPSGSPAHSPVASPTAQQSGGSADPYANGAAAAGASPLAPAARRLFQQQQQQQQAGQQRGGGGGGRSERRGGSTLRSSVFLPGGFDPVAAAAAAGALPPQYDGSGGTAAAGAAGQQQQHQPWGLSPERRAQAQAPSRLTVERGHVGTGGGHFGGSGGGTHFAPLQRQQSQYSHASQYSRQSSQYSVAHLGIGSRGGPHLSPSSSSAMLLDGDTLDVFAEDRGE
jgi:hypothetical protein